MVKDWTGPWKSDENAPFPRSYGKWSELSRKDIYENPWIKVTESEVRNPNGGQGIYGVVHFKNLAIGIIPLDEQGNTWLVGQERFPFCGKYTWEIIEGGGPLDRDPLESARMELSEEAGLAANDWQLIQETDLSNSATTERSLIYLACDLHPRHSAADSTELLTLRKVPFTEVYHMVLRGEIMDSLSVLGVLKLKVMQDEGLI